jgi:hypothetical protein
MAGDANAFGIVLATEDPCDVTAESGQAEARYVFLICSERCGSNLIAAILGAHSQVQSPPAYRFGRDVVLNLHLRDDPSGWEVVRQQLLERVRTQGSPEAAARLRAYMDTQPDASARQLAHFVYSGLEPKPGANTVFVKENSLHRLIGFVLECFPRRNSSSRCATRAITSCRRRRGAGSGRATSSARCGAR